MRIGIDGHMLGDHSGGNESYYTNILLNMKIPADMEVFLFVKKTCDHTLFEDKFNIVYFEECGAFRRNFIELPCLCKKYDLDLLHTQYFIPLINMCPVVCTIHDICFEHYSDIFKKKEYWRQKALIPFAAHHSKAIFTVSKDAKNDITNQYKIDSDKVVVTYNAVNNNYRILDRNELNESEIREKFSLGDSRIILSVGNLQPRKNLPRLIRAYLGIKDLNKKNVKLVIVGKKAWLYNDIFTEAFENQDKIIFTDYVEESDLIRLYNIANCFVYPSFFEGFGIPPLEAMACGTPVAVANATSLPEVVGDAGIYFDPYNEGEIMEAIEKMLLPDYLTEALKEKMEKRVKAFSWEKSADTILNTYRKIINN